MTPEQAASQSIAYVHDSQAGINMVNEYLGRTLTAIHRCPNGCLLSFDSDAEYLLVVSASMPMFGQPVPSGPGFMEMPLLGYRDTVAVAKAPRSMQIKLDWWHEAPEETQHLVGKILTGYAPSRSRVEDGREVESCMLEFNITHFLVVTTVSVYVMMNNNPGKPS